MHLLRVRVPKFKALKDVDITFEQDFVPKVFPLGSQNGGGKSTLLQLIFVLLHCTQDVAKLPFVKAMLAHFILPPEEEAPKLLAQIDIWDGEKRVEIEFLCFNDNFLKSWPRFEKGKENSFSILSSLERNPTSNLYTNFKQKILSEKNLIYITAYSEKAGLFCCVKNLEINEVEKFLKQLARKVFLAAPSTQVHIFLPINVRKSLFKIDKSNYYLNKLAELRTTLINFFIYDFHLIDTLVDAFKTARNKDFEQVVQTGQYGGYYQNLLNDMNKLLSTGKTVLPRLRASEESEGFIEGVHFKTNTGREIYPEDLSHGELKRLSIYTWIRNRSMQDSIVLMDEIENGFHPDWQYQIVIDLTEWAPTNQYILATHSHELCQAVTPAHVKAIEPYCHEFSNLDEA